MELLCDDVFVELVVRLPVRCVARVAIAAPFVTRRHGLLDRVVQRQRAVLAGAGVDTTRLQGEAVNLRHVARLSGGLNAVPAWFARWLHEILEGICTDVVLSWECIKRVWQTDGEAHFGGLLQFWPDAENALEADGAGTGA